MQNAKQIIKQVAEIIYLASHYKIPVDKPAAMHTCQWGSNTGKAASQPAVDFCLDPTSPQPYTGCVLYSQLAVFTVWTYFDLSNGRY